MAIRDDFTAGEVLAAADLNDTFAEKIPYAYGTATPTTTVDGYVWFDENETPPAPKFWDGAAFQAVSAPSGLVHIATESFSAVSSVSVNNCFTSVYENYLVIIGFTNSAGAYIDFRLRASGTDNSTANYSYQGIQANDTSVTAFRGSTQTAGQLTYSQAQDGSAIVDFLSPQLAVPTKYFSRGNRGTTTPIAMTYNGYHNVSSAFDGVTVYPQSGTFTGTIRVYGYQNS